MNNRTKEAHRFAIILRPSSSAPSKNKQKQHESNRQSAHLIYSSAQRAIKQETKQKAYARPYIKRRTTFGIKRGLKEKLKTWPYEVLLEPIRVPRETISIRIET